MKLEAGHAWCHLNLIKPTSWELTGKQGTRYIVFLVSCQVLWKSIKVNDSTPFVLSTIPSAQVGQINCRAQPIQQRTFIVSPGLGEDRFLCSTNIVQYFIFQAVSHPQKWDIKPTTYQQCYWFLYKIWLSNEINWIIAPNWINISLVEIFGNVFNISNTKKIKNFKF